MIDHAHTLYYSLTNSRCVYMGKTCFFTILVVLMVAFASCTNDEGENPIEFITPDDPEEITLPAEDIAPQKKD